MERSQRPTRGPGLPKLSMAYRAESLDRSLTDAAR